MEKFDAAEVKCAILSSAKHVSGLEGKIFAEGILDLPAAVEQIINGCSSSANRKGQSQNESLIVSPTIITEDLNIAFNLASQSQVSISFYSLNGQLIQAFDQQGKKGQNEITLNLSNMEQDRFMIVKVETNEFTKTIKVISVQ